ncbi:unnamed protein product [Eruca vesicaria subsp. sativa]|uniref:indole-3-pyruvate monooxygenase n=1 Tax=Eruca vesicaria subsp. sativa TaxID=29727 RepID=A0ABC8JHV5_ERUVS|nr:unnamed protein product [Eruca vesicaria subsp. sativa]
MGPMERKVVTEKTPVLDIGAMEKIKSGQIDIAPGIKRFARSHVELVDGQILDLDAVVLATGYRSNVPSWLQENDLFSKKRVYESPFPNAWKGKSGLYAAGFTRKGLAGASADAVSIAQEIGNVWREETKRQKMRTRVGHRRCISVA